MIETTGRAWLLPAVGALASIVLHAGIVLLLGRASLESAKRARPSPVRVRLVSARPPEIAPAPRVSPKPEPLPVQRPVRQRPALERQAPSRPEPASEVVELTGVTLTNEGPGAGWAAPAGNGKAGDGPIRLGLGASVRGAQPAAPSANPRANAGADVSQKPAPPALDAVLKRNYPPEARQRGIGGLAVVRARIDSDGHVRSASLLTETARGFGAACQKTLHGSRWRPALDRSGRPLATQVSYTCHFRVDD
jgi:periplasmic protein TonB